MNTDRIDARTLSRMFLAGAKRLNEQKDVINELNVFPVPDGDTGTNMTMTIMSAAGEVEKTDQDDMAAVCKSISTGSLRGARGNSGVILSQLLRGFTKVAREQETLDAEVLAESFDKAVETAYKAVMKPTEGTILTVARVASECADKTFAEGGDTLAIFEAAFEGAKQALATSAADVDGMMDEKLISNPSQTVKDLLVEKTATIGEKLSIRRFEKVEGDCVVSYIHGGGRIGVLVVGNGAGNGPEVKEALTNVAMQVAAMNPQYVNKSEISDAAMAKEREIVIDSALNDPASLPKPILNALIERAYNENIWSAEDKAIYDEKKTNMQFLFNFLSDEAAKQLAALAMEGKEKYLADKVFGGLVDGRINKHLKEICLLDQAYVKAEDGKQPVAKYLESVNKDLTVAKFVRFEVGEGMEKKNEDFAAEVAAQAAQ